jgi:hypothetical protein
MSEIPGVGVLGYGFDALGSYDVSSVTQEIFTHQTMDAEDWEYQPSGITYQVPDNTSIIPFTTTSGSGQVFSTQQQYQGYLAAKAGISGSYGGFSGAFNFAYSQTLNTQRSWYYGLYEAEYTGWKLGLADQSASWVSSDFAEDPDVEVLPTTFTPANEDLFFAVFRKFGTHFVAQVTLGGALTYYVAVQRSYSSDEQKVEANVSLEYKAVFMSTKATAEAEWQQLGQTWASSRLVKVDAVGGSAAALNALDPGYGDSDSTEVSSWAQDVMSNPNVTDFELRPLSLLFSGDRATAVDQAIEAYLNGAVLVYANSDYTPSRGPGGSNFTTSSGIVVNGTPMRPDPAVPQPTPTIYGGNVVCPIAGYQIALLDPSDMTPILSHIYYQEWDPWVNEPKVYDAIMADLDQVSATGYLAFVAGFAIDLMNYPSTGFAQWLGTVGASLSGWRQYISFTGSPGQASYVCLGKQGWLPGRAVEGFAATPNWVGYPWAATTDTSGLMLLYASSALSIEGRRAFGSFELDAPEPVPA